MSDSILASQAGRRTIVLGIETSCDETAAAVVASDRTVLSSRVHSQIESHRPYGGVVPEVAARDHLAHLHALVRGALDDAGVAVADLDAIAATAGPGLIGGVIVGSVTAKAMAAAAELPYLAINHLEGHALTPRLTDGVAFPYLLLLASGGHCQLLEVLEVGRYRRLGTTIDDAAGEAFDKTAKLLSLGFPGGPAIESAAANGDPTAVDLPRPMLGRPGCDMSFSGLKAAVRRLVEGRQADGQEPLSPRDVADIAASFQAAVVDCLADRTARALADCSPGIETLVVAGGVAANTALRTRLSDLATDRRLRFVAPPLSLCGDNAAMIAWAGIERRRHGADDPLTTKPRPRWPLDPDAPPRRGAGVKA